MKNIWTVLAALMLCAVAWPQAADARPWKPEGAALAEDYAIIQDHRSGGDLVVLFWFASPLVEKSPVVQAMLEKYVILAVVHGHFEPGGTATFDPVDALTAMDADGKPLTLLQGDDMPPAIVGSMAVFGAMMKRVIGQMGEGMHFFAFDAGNVHACAPGRLSIPFAGETYTYDTPFPGCPKP